MAAAGAPKNAGRKLSKRKRSNAKTELVLQQIDLLQHNPDELPPDGLGNPEAIRGQFNIAVSSVPLQSSSQYMHHLFLFKAAVSITSHLLFFKAAVSIVHHLFLFKAVVSITFHLVLFKAAVSTPFHLVLFKAVVSMFHLLLFKAVVIMACHISSAHHLPIQSCALLRQVEGTPNRNVTQQIGTPTHPYAPQHGLHGIPQGPPTTGTRSFTLKWLMGTTVSRCYGCGKVIQNPPLNCPDDLIVMCHDFHHFQHRITGQLTTSSKPQNVHFYLRLACVRARYPHFVPSSIHVPPNFVHRFQVEHLGRLLLEFGWKPGHWNSENAMI